LFLKKKRFDLGRTDLQRVERSIYSALQQNNGRIRFKIKIMDFVFCFFVFFRNEQAYEFHPEPHRLIDEKKRFLGPRVMKKPSRKKKPKNRMKNEREMCFASSLAHCIWSRLSSPPMH
jgi:hypothetical protein